MSFQSRNGVINQATYTYPERQWATPISIGGQQPEVVITCQISAITTSF